ncbi:MAG: site-specific integrase [Marmoricola sp.]|nr:site-specific integrase [Marmoricola sp.]
MAWSRLRISSDGSSHFTGYYRSPDGHTRSAGTFTSKRAALRAAGHFEHKVLDGSWIDPALGDITFRQYVEQVWLPSRHLELSTRQAYVSILHAHFLPFFGHMRMKRILPSTVQSWVTKVSTEGTISPVTIKKNHVMLHSVFRRAVRDRIIPFNPCTETELPKIVKKQIQTLTPEEYARLYAEIPERYQDFVQTCIETGMRWGELAGLRPRHIDFLRRVVTIEETIVEISKRHSPTGDRNVVKPYPKNNAPRVIGVRQPLLDRLAARIQRMDLSRDDLIFPSTDRAGGAPISRNTFRTKVWLPAVERAGISFPVRMHDLRHAHASWLLAGGADLVGVMERLGHAQIQTTQRYLHTLPDSDQKNLDAFSRIADRI